MNKQRSWIKLWARTVGMEIGDTDHDDPKIPVLTQRQARRALALRTFWIVLHITTCAFIIASNGKNIGLWLNEREYYERSK